MPQGARINRRNQLKQKTVHDGNTKTKLEPERVTTVVSTLKKLKIKMTVKWLKRTLSLFKKKGTCNYH